MVALRLVDITVLWTVCVFWCNQLLCVCYCFRLLCRRKKLSKSIWRREGEEYRFYLRRYSMLINWISHCGDWGETKEEKMWWAENHRRRGDGLYVHFYFIQSGWLSFISAGRPGEVRKEERKLDEKSRTERRGEGKKMTKKRRWKDRRRERERDKMDWEKRQKEKKLEERRDGEKKTVKYL